MPESTQENLQISNLWIAGLCALLAHLALLVMTAGMGQLSPEVKPGISFRLIPRLPVKAESEQEQYTEPSLETPRQRILPQPRVAPSLADNQQNQFQPREISPQAISRWADTQRPVLGQQHNGELSRFKNSFDEPVMKKAEPQQSFTNVYGEQHVVTRVNGKDVCFMQPTPIYEDDWSPGVVMFYDCARPEKFELPRP